MSYHRILTIQDISCVGQCSMTVALPILSACGQETCILPSAVLSTHTGGFGEVEIQDLSHSMEPIMRRWVEEKITFDAIYTGYLGRISHMETVQTMMGVLKKSDGLFIVDPAMADHGKLYCGFDGEYVKAMKTLCAESDLMLPNITEACMITGKSYKESFSREEVEELARDLAQLNDGAVVLTGVGFEPGETGVAICQGGEVSYYFHKKIPQSYHGTGDIFASALVGCYMAGKTLHDAAKIAADYTALCIQNTYDDPAHWYGVKFETALGALIEMLK